MLNMVDPSMLVPRGQSRLNSLRDLARRNVRLRTSSAEDMWMPVFLHKNTPPDFFDEAPGPTRFEEVEDSSPFARSRPPRPNDRYSSHHDLDPRWDKNDYDDNHEYHRPKRSATIPFDRAATNLKNSLDTAVKFCRDVETEFEHEVSGIASWAGRRAIDALWTMKMAWDGVPADDDEDNGGWRNRSTRAPATVVTFDKVVRSLQDAMDDFRAAEKVHVAVLKELSSGRREPETERVLILLSKLEVELRGVEELCERVRRSRKSLGVLRGELADASQLVSETRGLWRGSGIERGKHGWSGGGY